ncbi:hypothetical protein QBC33DRAFT_559226 [Phialemonium atrogriseum]|uniref:Helix-turn-helix domain-containing protein n=1 Tax=Phialemonium atrogriseum TaxID=1093897 RepID=A0AAJ0FL85_9PEZI|nr:uncharacterized protein QBC33DRAFT_559226 [Phialemonium atrogriseum]KAK1767098.1 hypothetical protein QBC33DRAFT_559226 [Phialemonium atrogriseum]
MGSSTSKAAQSGARKFPTRAPGAAAPPPPPPRPSRTRPAPPPPRAQASFTKDEAIRADSINPGATPDSDYGASPAFSARLRRMGVAQPNPTFSPSSTAASSSPPPPPPPSSSSHPGPGSFPPAAENATLGVLESRRRLQESADREFLSGGGGREGREFLDVGTIRDALVLRQRGVAAGDIEARLGLRRGVVGRFGAPGVVVSVVGGETA